MKKIAFILLVFLSCIITGCHKFIEPNVQIGATTLSVGDTTILEWSNVKSMKVYLLHPEDSICVLMDSTSNSIKIYAKTVGKDTLCADFYYLYKDKVTNASGMINRTPITVLPKE